MRDDARHSAFLWAMGAAWGLTFGLVIALLLRDRRRGSQAQLASPVTINFGTLPAGPVPVTQAATPYTAASTRPTKLETFTLSADPTNPSRVATAASERHWTVRLHNVGPPGSFAAVSTNFAGAAFPSSQSIQIPAGGDHTIRLRPREALFASGSVAGVLLSVSSSEDLA